MNSDMGQGAAVIGQEEKAKDAREVMQAQKDLKTHLKSLSKNELVQTVIQIAQALAVQIETTRALNENLKLLLKQDSAKDILVSEAQRLNLGYEDKIEKEQNNEKDSASAAASPE